MKLSLVLCLCFSINLLPAQTADLLNFEVTLIGPRNTDLHHPNQIAYYADYYNYLEEEVDLFIKEINKDLRAIRKRNRRRIENRRPIKSRDYPAWKNNTAILEDLKKDKQLVQVFQSKWENFNYEQPDSVVKVFMSAFDENLCFDLISKKLVLAPKEYEISLSEPLNKVFEWREFIPKNSLKCPDEYTANGKTCWRKMSVDIENSIDPVFLIENELTDMPFHLDGFKQITCRR